MALTETEAWRILDWYWTEYQTGSQRGPHGPHTLPDPCPLIRGCDYYPGSCHPQCSIYRAVWQAPDPHFPPAGDIPRGWGGTWGFRQWAEWWWPRMQGDQVVFSGSRAFVLLQQCLVFAWTRTQWEQGTAKIRIAAQTAGSAAPGLRWVAVWHWVYDRAALGGSTHLEGTLRVSRDRPDSDHPWVYWVCQEGETITVWERRPHGVEAILTVPWSDAPWEPQTAATYCERVTDLYVPGSGGGAVPKRIPLIELARRLRPDLVPTEEAVLDAGTR